MHLLRGSDRRGQPRLLKACSPSLPLLLTVDKRVSALTTSCCLHAASAWSMSMRIAISRIGILFAILFAARPHPIFRLRRCLLWSLCIRAACPLL